MGMTSLTKALGPEPQHWTAALNMQLPKTCYSQVFLKNKENFKALNVTCSK